MQAGAADGVNDPADIPWRMTVDLQELHLVTTRVRGT